MKPCAVEATFTTNGDPQPRSLTWDDTILPIKEVGRRWTDDQGLHLLARVIDGRVFELLYNGAGWQGQSVSQPPQFT